MGFLNFFILKEGEKPLKMGRKRRKKKQMQNQWSYSVSEWQENTEKHLKDAQTPTTKNGK